MGSHDERFDPLFQKMVEAFRGDPAAWRGVNQALRDAIVAYARERSAYYREHIPPGTTFEEIPVLTRPTVRERRDELVVDGTEARQVAVRGSGSTGEPLSFFRDTTQGPAEHTSGERFLRWLQGIPFDATKVWISTLPRGILGRRAAPFGLRRSDAAVHGVLASTLSPRRIEREVRRWTRFRSYFVYGVASLIDVVAEHVERRGLRPARSPIAVVTTADTLTRSSEARIARAFGCPVHSWYGSNEFNGFVAGTVPGTRRYAFNPLLVHAEVLADDGSPARPGSPGRIMLTDLNNYVMPFIRYDTGDVAVPSEDGFVGGFRLVDDIHGRSSETLRLPSGRAVSGSALGARLFVDSDLTREVRFWQCAQVAPDVLELRVVWAREASDEAIGRIVEALRQVLDPTTVVRVRGVDRLERLPSGKAWLVRREF
ncbi:MAG TPA: hypothetical protein VG709_03915 [Actinomycetota bacterium]|nr:hypothetical protein [Actinomycetota bacterium]